MVTKAVQGTDRRVCVSCRRIHYNDPKIAVGVAVFRDDGLLLVRRVMEPGRGKWALPGGWVDAGQDPRAAAAREALEEAGVVIEVGAIVDAVLTESDGAIFLLFDGRWVSGEPVAGDDADGAGFFGRDRLPPMAGFASDALAIARWPGAGAE
jgi:ADP-ribose pyrophosphatase YjhB (NUDIX family)